MGDFTGPVGSQHGPQAPVPPPVLSPDGQSYWNGQSWQPVAALGPDGRPLPLLKRPVRPAVLILVTMLAGLVLLVGISAARESDADQQQLQDHYRQQWGKDNPTCPQGR